MSIATENFIKTIYQLNQQQTEDCKTGIVAKKLGVSSAAATDMAKKLASQSLLNYQRYKTLKLTKKGDVLALSIIRKHRLWETFLFEVLGLNFHEIHREAEGLEHQTSDFLANRISEYLGFPEFDPHGDPIPTADGRIKLDKKSVALNKAIANRSYKVVRLVSDDKEFFEFCQSSGINNNVQLLIVNQFEKTKMTELSIGQKTLLLHSSFTQNILLHEVNI